MNKDSLTIKAVFDDFNQLYERAVSIVGELQFALGIMGVIGSSIGLTTMLTSKSMRTTSFSYHKVLTAASLVSCLNSLGYKLCADVFAVRRFTYSHRMQAVYAGFISRAIASSCGYVGLYMSLFVALDRCIALLWPLRYAALSKAAFSRIIISTAVILSICLHSWATWVDNMVFTVTNPRTNQTFFTYKSHLQVPKGIIKIKDVYNAVLRVPYPFFLGILTAVSIWLFKKKQKQAAEVVDRKSRAYKKALARDRSLFVLMICVVILAFVRVVPREVQRILEFTYPKNDMMHNTLSRQFSLAYRVRCFRMLLYGHKLLTVICNLCATIDRGLLFYLYFALNSSFRHAVKNMFFRVFCCRPQWDTSSGYSSVSTAASPARSLRSLRSVGGKSSYGTIGKEESSFGGEQGSTVVSVSIRRCSDPTLVASCDSALENSSSRARLILKNNGDLSFKSEILQTEGPKKRRSSLQCLVHQHSAPESVTLFEDKKSPDPSERRRVEFYFESHPVVVD